MSNKPLVSCVMPTWNRRNFIPAAVDCFLRQTYEPKELVILDDGEEPIEDLLPKDDRIRYIFESRRRLTGDKRNRVNSMTKGQLIAHWDDDDWSADGRLEYQVALLQATGKRITGFSNLVFWSLTERRPLIWKSEIRGYICGTTMCYERELWNTRQFRNRQKATDNDFVYPIISQVAASNETRFMVARIHGCHHTSSKAGIRKEVPRNRIPDEFWENDKLRI